MKARYAGVTWVPPSAAGRAKVVPRAVAEGAVDERVNILYWCCDGESYVGAGVGCSGRHPGVQDNEAIVTMGSVLK